MDVWFGARKVLKGEKIQRKYWVRKEGPKKSTSHPGKRLFGKDNPSFGIRRFGEENYFFGKKHTEESK